MDLYLTNLKIYIPVSPWMQVSKNLVRKISLIRYHKNVHLIMKKLPNLFPLFWCLSCSVLFFYSLCNFSYIQLERSCICSSLGTNALHSISLIPQTRDSNVTHKTTEFLRNKQDRSQWHFWTTLLFCIAPRVRPEPGFGKVENWIQSHHLHHQWKL